MSTVILASPRRSPTVSPRAAVSVLGTVYDKAVQLNTVADDNTQNRNSEVEHAAATCTRICTAPGHAIGNAVT